MILTPPPEEVADVLATAARATWPATEAETKAFLAHLQVVYLGQADEPERGYQQMSFRALPWENASGLLSTWQGQLLGVDWVCYQERGDNGRSAKAGFVAVRDALTDRLGSPAEEWGPATEPAARWVCGDCSVEMYCHQRGSSALQAGVVRLDRSRDFEARHRRQHPSG